MAILKTGDVAVIIGSATGIGRAAARKWALQGVKLALFDNSEERLTKLVKEIGSQTTVVSAIGNVATLEDVNKFKAQVFDKYDRVDLLFLNAGMQITTGFDNPVDIRKIFDVNFFGVVNGTSAFVESLKKQSTPSHIVITGSKQGITNPPGNPGYNATKAAVKSFAEGLSFSLQGTHAEAHLLIPGWTHTYLTGDRDSGATPKPRGAWYPEQVVDRLEEGITNEEFYIFCDDTDVTFDIDSKRMKYGLGDMTERRPALSRWRPQFKEAFDQFMADN